MSVISDDELPFDQINEQNEENAMWRGYHAEMKRRANRTAHKAALLIGSLSNRRKLDANWHTEYHVTLTNPDTKKSVEFYPTRGTIVRDRVREGRVGIDAALKLIGVRR